ncbi:MAG: hypothetical protein HYV63_34835 [Candidatus Schekmanbacteria bacterium]|nr:hypothetical protein [Candidatus Schekmanbacteria bacterium]
MTEFSSPLMLDRRVRNVLVTSCAEQSVMGTEHALKQVEARTNWTPEIDIIVTQVPNNGDERFAEINRRIDEIWAGMDEDTTAQVTSTPPTVHRVDFSDTLLVFDELQVFARRIPGTSLAQVGRAVAEGLAPSHGGTASTSDVTTRRIADLAEQLEYAENNAELGLLPTPSLQHLANQPPGQMPVAVVLGSKGAGKTFTWGQLVVAARWNVFRHAVGATLNASFDAVIFPLLFPAHLGDKLRQRALEVEKQVRVGDGPSLTSGELAGELADSETRINPLQLWTEAIARRLGLPKDAGTSVLTLENALATRNKRVVLVVDGIEDALQTGPTKPMSEGQQALLRVLLTELVVQMRDLGSKYLGMIVFVRRDLARAAILQNFGQFEAKHRQVAITWSHTDGLRLTLWLLQRAGWSLMDAATMARAPYEALAESLQPFWGVKMGGAREAYTDRWVIAALSDLNGRFQARDLVRLVGVASRLTEGLPLTPKAIREAVKDCSVRKIEELQTEMEELAPIFEKLKGLHRNLRTIPIGRADLPLGDDEIGFLNEQGILFYEEKEQQYYMPQTIQHGLGFEPGRRGRARVLSLLRAAMRNRP